MQKSKFTVRDMVLVGVLAALVYVASLYLQFPIPTPLGNTRIHFGNVMCLLSGLLLGPVPGGLAAGIGSALFDLSDPRYTASLPFTFVFKFAMAYLCGVIAWSAKADGERWSRNAAAAASGAVLYVVLYLGKNFIENYFYLRLELGTVLVDIAAKGVTSAVNGIIAAVISVPLAAMIRKGLARSGFQLKKA